MPAALDRLGLVERRENVGALVRSFDTKTVEELYQVRMLLEAEAARLIPLPVAASDLKVLVAIQREHDAAVKKATSAKSSEAIWRITRRCST